MALTAKKKAFAQAKHDGANNKEAAIFAGCSPETASQAGSRMAKDPDVIAHLERLTSVKDINTDVKPDQKPIITKKDIETAGSRADPLKFLEEIWTDPVEDMKMRMDAAKAALQSARSLKKARKKPKPMKPKKPLKAGSLEHWVHN